MRGKFGVSIENKEGGWRNESAKKESPASFAESKRLTEQSKSTEAACSNPSISEANTVRVFQCPDSCSNDLRSNARDMRKSALILRSQGPDEWSERRRR